MRPLQDLKFVDMIHSKWDKQKSNPKKGQYVFTDKKYVEYGDEGRRLDYFFRWNRNHPDDIANWKDRWNFSLVNASDKLVWVEGKAPDEEGHYVHGDVILMKIRIEDYIAKRKPEIERSEFARKRMFEGFNRDAQQAGRAAPQEMVEEILLQDISDKRPPRIIKSRKIPT
jgi:hypothetical protein